jgi:hypothetical protein
MDTLEVIDLYLCAPVLYLKRSVRDDFSTLTRFERGRDRRGKTGSRNKVKRTKNQESGEKLG